MRRRFIFLVLLCKAAGLGLLLTGANVPLALAVFFVPGLILLASLLVPSAPGLVRVCTRFETPRREVWLTIDDGPDPVDTPRTLKLLARHGARATFFLIGRKAAEHPNLVEAIRDAGHEIGHHTHTHPSGSFWCAGPARAARELEDACATFAAIGVVPTRFRPPVGIKNLFLEPLLEARALVCVGWTIRSWDSVRTDPDSLVAHVRQRLQPGAIILLHEGPRLAPAIRERGLAGLLEAITDDGYRCVVPEAGQLRSTP
jgi:peptidoglycan/xylan/chitin deacetylase (PgdA/CDA1 family)